MYDKCKNDLDNVIVDLKKAIEIDKQVIKLAKEDRDFESIRNDGRFKVLITNESEDNRIKKDRNGIHMMY